MKTQEMIFARQNQVSVFGTARALTERYTGLSMVSRRQFLASAAVPPLAAQRSQRPNIVFVLIDDLRWDALGCTGHPFAKTPHIDRIAKEGARFTDSFVAIPLCSPSRASFLTGQYAHKHTIRGNGDNAALSHRLVTFPRLLHEAGYETAYIGKWHMGTDDSPRPGFDRWVSFRGQGRFEDPPLNIDGKAVDQKGYMTDLLGGYAAEFIRKPRSKPFCLCLAHKAVHGPFTPAERHKSMFSGETIRRSENAKDQLAGKPAMTRLIEGKPAVSPGGGSGDELIKNQMRCMLSVDDSVGGIFKALEDTGQLDNTLIVFTSDNGYFWGEHGLGDKRWAFEESIRIPMLMRWPKQIRAGSVIVANTLSIDIAPTVMEAAGLKVHAQMQGMSLLPVIGGKKSKWRQAVLTEYFAEGNFPRTPSWQSVRTAEWKYVHYTGLEGMDELYAIGKDPGEMRNLISDPAADKALGKMKALLAAELKATA